MKLLIYSLLLFISFHTSAQGMEQQFYYLKLSSNNSVVECFVNGFPVYQIDSPGQVTNQIPINLALIGKNNVLKVVARPMGENAFVTGNITSYQGSEVVSTDDEKPGVLTFRQDVTKELDLNYVFDNEKFDFSRVLKESPVIQDSSRLINYALKLESWIKNKDTKALLKQMSPKINDYAASYSVPSDIMEESMKQSLTNDMFETNWEEVNKHEIVPVSYCGGRVWELTTGKGHPLFYTENEEGSTSLHIFVAKVDGKLRVVR